ncbi:MAG TPA: HAD family phosphatase [Clostridia bacterium]|nr:HAD family phosphatase [Clostridia bacterium]
MIRNVIFDVGNVLERFDPDFLLSKLVADDALRASLRGKIFGTPVWLMLDRGTVEEREALERFCARHPQWREAAANILAHWTEHMRPFEHSVPLLKRLRAEGYRLFLLSNYHAPAFWRVSWHEALPDLTDGIMLSSDARLLKPDPALYQRLCEAYGLEPGQSLFLDDQAANVEVAEYLGFQTLHVLDPDGLADLRVG